MGVEGISGPLGDGGISMGGTAVEGGLVGRATLGDSGSDAMDELRFFAHHIEIFGVYPASPFREQLR